jgi:hypothetical protein
MQTAAGQRALVSAHVNTLLRDLVKQAKAAHLAQACNEHNGLE